MKFNELVAGQSYAWAPRTDNRILGSAYGITQVIVLDTESGWTEGKTSYGRFGSAKNGRFMKATTKRNVMVAVKSYDSSGRLRSEVPHNGVVYRAAVVPVAQLIGTWEDHEAAKAPLAEAQRAAAQRKANLAADTKARREAVANDLRNLVDGHVSDYKPEELSLSQLEKLIELAKVGAQKVEV